MDVFVFKNPSQPILMEQGEIINGLTSKMWVERYAESGEFRFVAPVSSGLKEKLPIGSFVSHTDTYETMIVENHEINDTQDEESKITVTGRGFETFLEQRVVGSNRLFPRMVSDGKFLVPAQKTWDQVVHLINQHINASYLNDDNNSLPYVSTQTSLSGPGVNKSRKIDVRDLYSVILELMTIDDLGIRIVRPGVWSPIGPTSPNTAIIIHKGIDRTKQVIFSYEYGEIENADYLWSNKNLKTSALVIGKWVQAIVHLPGFTNYRRRMMQVSATDIDEEYDEGSAAFFLTVIGPLLQERGLEALKSQKDVVLTKAEVSKQMINSEYRINFDVGDLITVVGDYNESSVMRVKEFVEIEDENGTVAYPTLSLET